MKRRPHDTDRKDDGDHTPPKRSRITPQGDPCVRDGLFTSPDGRSRRRSGSGARSCSPSSPRAARTEPLFELLPSEVVQQIIIPTTATDWTRFRRVCKLWKRLLPENLCAFLPDEQLEAAYIHQSRFDLVGDPMARQRDIQAPMRHVLVDWMTEIATEFSLSDWTLHLAVNMLDRYLVSVSVTRNNLQLVGATAVLLASKYAHKDGDGPSAVMLVSMSAQAFNLAQLLRLEREMLQVLQCHIWLPTPSGFLSLFVERLNYAVQAHIIRPNFPSVDTVLQLASFIAEQAIQDHRTVQYSPSTIASATLALAIRNLGVSYWNNSGLLRFATGLHDVEEPAVVGCMQALVTACVQCFLTPNNGTRRRFAQRISVDLMSLPISACAALSRANPAPSEAPEAP